MGSDAAQHPSRTSLVEVQLRHRNRAAGHPGFNGLVEVLKRVNLEQPIEHHVLEHAEDTEREEIGEEDQQRPIVGYFTRTAHSGTVMVCLRTYLSCNTRR